MSETSDNIGIGNKSAEPASDHCVTVGLHAFATKPYTFVVAWGDGMQVTIHRDGTIELPPGWTAEKAADPFWKALTNAVLGLGGHYTPPWISPKAFVAGHGWKTDEDYTCGTCFAECAPNGYCPACRRFLQGIDTAKLCHCGHAIALHTNTGCAHGCAWAACEENGDAHLPHDFGGMCLVCRAIELAVAPLQAAIRKHRDARGHDRCFENDRELYRVLGEAVPASPALPPREEFHAGCAGYYKEQSGDTAPFCSAEQALAAERTRLWNEMKDLDIVCQCAGMGRCAGCKVVKIARSLKP